MSSTHYTYQQLYLFSQNIFKSIGCSDEHAATATKTLLSADLRGIDSNGITALSGIGRL